MFAKIALLRPHRGDYFLTYEIPDLFAQAQAGDIVEVPFRNEREAGVVFEVLKEKPEFETKMMGKILQEKFYSQKFLDFLSEISEFFFCSPSFFLSKTAPIELIKNEQNSPQEKYFEKGEIPEISAVKGKKQKELCEFFQNFLEKKNKESLVSAEELKEMFSAAVIKSAEEKGYIAEIFQEKFPEISLHKNSLLEIPEFFSAEEFTKLFPEISGEGEKKYEPRIVIGSNFSEKNALLMRWIREKLEKNQQVIFVFPDTISLEQAYLKFLKIFPEKFLEKYSSGTTEVQRKNLFWKLKNGHSKILLGTKNALFLPMQNLGGIIVHEYHNDLYATMNFPHTHAKDIAKIRAKSENISLIFSATTGDIDEVFLSTEKIIEFSEKNPAEIFCADMNLERMNGNNSSISSVLEKNIAENLQKKQQTILFLNRKGMFTALMCTECQWSPTSPLSGNKLGVFRGKDGKKVLRCTQSKYHEIFPHVCPQCKKNTLIELGKGTQEVEEYIQKKFPQARIFRADRDTLSSANKSKEFLAQMEAGEIDIVVGTQMIVQAFPFTNVSLVANIITENDVLFPSFRAEEKGFVRNMKLFDLLGNISGRKIVVQTFCPQHPFLKKILQRNFQQTFSSEISGRKPLFYPPFSTSIQLILTGKNANTLEQKAQELQREISGISQKIFPVQMSYHPQKNLHTAKLLCFVKNTEKIEAIIKTKNIRSNRYGE